MINVCYPSLISVETEKGLESYILPNTLDLMSVSEKMNEKITVFHIANSDHLVIYLGLEKLYIDLKIFGHIIKSL